MVRGDTIMQLRVERLWIDEWSSFLDIAGQIDEFECPYDAVDFHTRDQVTFGWEDARGWFSAGVFTATLQDALVSMAIRESYMEYVPSGQGVKGTIIWEMVHVSDVQDVIEEVMALDELAALAID